MRTDEKKQKLILFLIGGFVSAWLGLIIAPLMADGLKGIINGLGFALSTPFNIRLCENSLKTVLIVLRIYLIAAGCLMSSGRNYRKQQEYGSAKWGDPKVLNRKYSDKHYVANRLLTNSVSLGPDGRKHRRNLNVLVCGGSGSGKTRYYAKPNILQANTSFVVLDPKGEILRDTGNLLQDAGYEIRILDMINMEKSHCYNPFVYLKTDNDAQRLVTNIFKNTTPKDSRPQEPFWDVAAQMLLMAIVLFLMHEAPPEEQNFPMVLYLIRSGEIKESNDSAKSPLDRLFDRLAIKDPQHIALKYYRSYHSGSAKTLKSIQITLMARLEKYNLDSLAGISKTDELELDKVGDRKTAIFAVIPDNDSSFNFIVGMLYTQLFQRLYSIADAKPDKMLSVPVHFVMDEFANVALPDEFDKLLSTMRSRGISVSIRNQNMAQLKALFEKQWESVVGNCDTFLYLGGNEASTHEYVTKLLGKETIDLNTYGRSKGRSGSFSTNWQLAGRELLTPDEVRMLDNRYALLFIRGERPVMDLKYDLLKHPNISKSADGGAKPYAYGTDKVSFASIMFEAPEDIMETVKDVQKHDYLIFTDDELGKLISKKMEEIKNEKKEQK